MLLQNKIYTDEFLEEFNLKLYAVDGLEDVNMVYTDNMGNRYNFVREEKGLIFVSFEKNKVNIF
ncbi:hypothetical protein LCGC14_2510230 [marine sediment metagenome]|uniref:Uncharacterized protein n=1 Tax=marine sediment metagenome TaxID=412755 RepID=A0A0F9AZZ6_9ZZZZ